MRVNEFNGTISTANRLMLSIQSMKFTISRLLVSLLLIISFATVIVDAETSVILQPGPGLNDGTDDGSAQKGMDAGFTDVQPWGRNDGSSPDMFLTNSPCNAGFFPSFLRFDLAGMPTENINSAEVQVYTLVFFNGAGWPWPVSPTISLHKVTQPWDEMAITQSSYPTYDGTTLSYNTINTVGGGSWGVPFTEFEGWLTFDITDAYKAWADGSVTNNGLSFVVDNSFCTNGDVIRIHTSDYTTDTSLRPKLIVNVEDAPTDTTAPVTTATQFPSPNVNGWNNVTVDVTLISADNGGYGVKEIHYSVDGSLETIVSGNTASIELTAEGMHTVNYYAVDNEDNIEETKSLVVNIDLTAPVITYTGNAGTYTTEQMITITCSVSDILSGIESATCQDIIGPASSFPLGLNSFTAIATDKANNIGTGTASFTVKQPVKPYDNIRDLIKEYVTKPGIVNSMLVKLDAAEAAELRGDMNARNGSLSALINEIKAQSGKSLTGGQATEIIGLVKAL